MSIIMHVTLRRKTIAEWLYLLKNYTQYDLCRIIISKPFSVDIVSTSSIIIR